MSDSQNKTIRVMSIMAHQDDFEFCAGGSFALLRKAYGEQAELLVLATSRGASGHHEMDLESTFRKREAEARAAAAVIGAKYECLTCLDGQHVPAQVLPDRNVLGGLWNAIRRFEPDVIFCPPVAEDPLAGIHVDHQGTAEAVRMVAYQLIVPHAYPTMSGPCKQRIRSPLIINVDDGYSAEDNFHIRQDISEVYDQKSKMASCHQSQVFEWLPFTRGYDRPIRPEEWEEELHARHLRINQRYRQSDEPVSEYFRITRWGRAPQPGELESLFPAMLENRFPQ